MTVLDSRVFLFALLTLIATGGALAGAQTLAELDRGGFDQEATTMSTEQATSAQQAALQCSFEFSPTGRSFGADGGSGAFSLATQIDCQWSASSNRSWITITSGSSGVGSGTVRYIVDPNNSGSSRSGTVTAGGEHHVVEQDGVVCSYDISPTGESFDASGGMDSIAVATQSVCQWSASSSRSWITITSGSSGMGSGTVQYSVAANSSSASRQGAINVAGEAFVVEQDGVTCTYDILPTNEFFGADGGVDSFAVSATADCPWTAVSSRTWITITSGTNGAGNGTVSYSVAVNSSGPRQGAITVAGKVHAVEQAGGNLPFFDDDFETGDTSAWSLSEPPAD